jgi:phage-related minor tail protein
MPRLADEQVRALLDGATPGPWRLIDDPDLARDLLDARAELARMRDALEDQADFLDQIHHARMTGLGRDPDKYTTELSAQRDKIRAALTTQEPKP